MTRDLRFAFRGLIRTPGFTLTALLALALGIGANTAIFSMVSPILFRPLPFPEPQQVVALTPHHKTSGREWNFSLPSYKDYVAQQHSFEALTAFLQGSVAVATPSEVTRIRALYATPGLFGVLKLDPLVGRNLVDADDDPKAPPVAVLSHWAWQRHFAGDRSVVGRAVQMDGKSFTVVGVMPEQFKLPGQGRGPGLYFPLTANIDVQKFGERRGHHNLTAIGRLKPGATPESARAEAVPICEGIEKVDDGESNLRIDFVDLQQRITAELRPAALVLFGAVFLVLLIACANVAGLLVVRAGARHREIAIRLSLGASRGRVVRQVLTEAVLLGVVGAGLGLLVALWTLDGLKALIGNRMPDIGIDGQVLAFTAAVGVFTGLVFGAVPALHASRVGLHEALKESGTRASLSRGRRRAQAALIGVQVALAFALLSGAGLMFQSLYGLMHLKPGFEPEQLVQVKLKLPDWSYSDEQKVAFFRRAIDAASALPGAASVGSGDPFPFLDGNSQNTVYPRGREPDRSSEQSGNRYEVSEGYFATMGIPLLEGRTFAPEERSVRGAIIVSQQLAKRFWPGESALGKELMAGGDTVYRVVGVVGDIRHGSLTAETKMAFYVPFEQSLWPDQSLLVRVNGPVEPMVNQLRALGRSLDPSLPAPDPEPVTAVLEQSESQRRVTLYMLVAFAAVALLLAALGLWGLIAYAVGQRRQELAIRLALGAPHGHLIGLVMRQGVVLIAIGLAGGIALAVAGSRVLDALLYGVKAIDPATYAGIALVLGLVALLACFLPARAATKVDPNAALRA